MGKDGYELCWYGVGMAILIVVTGNGWGWMGYGVETGKGCNILRACKLCNVYARACLDHLTK